MKYKTPLFDLSWLTLLGFAFFAVFIGSYHLLSPDEGRYIEVAREMVASGNYITPHLDGTVFLDKPILFYWLEAGLIKVFGLHQWSVRLLPVAIGILGVLSTYWAGLKVYNRRTGLVAALALMTMLLYFMAAHYTDMDLMIAVLISIGLWQFLIAMQLPRGRKRDLYLWSAYAVAGLAFLTKGLMGLVLPAMVIGLWILLTNRWSIIKQMRLISGLLLFLIIVTPWMIAVQHANPEFFNYFFIVQQFSRYLSNDFNMHKPFYFYMVVVLAGILPWTIFFFQSCYFFGKQIIKNWQLSSNELFIILWPLSIFIFFSIPESKVVGYILPVFPPIALMIGRYLDFNWQNLPQSRHLKRCTLILLLIGIIASISLIYTTSLHSVVRSASFVYLWSIAVVIMLGVVLTLALSLYSDRFKPVFIAILLTTIAANIIGIAGVWSFKLNNSKQVALQIKQRLHSGDKVVTFDEYYQDLPVYLKQRVYVVSGWSNPNIIKHDDWRRELAEGVLYKHYQQPLLLNYQQFTQFWKHTSQRIFIVTKADKVKHLKSLADSSVYQIGKRADMIIFSNQPE